MTLSADSLFAYLHERTGLAPGSLTLESPLFTSSLLDSLSLVDLIVFVESQMDGTRIDPDDVAVENFDSVAQILRFAEAKCAGASR
jgi:acyl carrier protein